MAATHKREGGSADTYREHSVSRASWERGVIATRRSLCDAIKKKPGELEIDRFTARQKSLLTTGKQVSDEGN